MNSVFIETSTLSTSDNQQTIQREGHNEQINLCTIGQYQPDCCRDSSKRAASDGHIAGVVQAASVYAHGNTARGLGHRFARHSERL
jgi:hypothetical protein